MDYIHESLLVPAFVNNFSMDSENLTVSCHNELVEPLESLVNIDDSSIPKKGKDGLSDNNATANNNFKCTSEVSRPVVSDTSKDCPKVHENVIKMKKISWLVKPRNSRSFNNSAMDDRDRRRPLRRVSNNNESVLQNAIALKEKSLGIATIHRNCRLPRLASEKRKVLNSKPVHQSEPQLSNPDTFSTSPPDSFSNEFRSNSVVAENCFDLFNGNSSSDGLHFIKNGLNDSTSATTNSSYVKTCSGIRKRRRYFKGYSYNFNGKRTSKRRRLLNGSYSRNRSSVAIRPCTLPANSKDHSRLKKNNGEKFDAVPQVCGVSISSIGSQSSIGTCLDLVIKTEPKEKSPPQIISDIPEKATGFVSPLSSVKNVSSNICLCQVHERVYMKAANDSKYHCQAVDSIEGKQIGCCNSINHAIDSDIKLQRPSIKISYLMLCEVHSHRMLIHNCCPACGLFCTQGRFATCEAKHTFHRRCEIKMGDERLCPHCARASSPADVSCSIGPDRKPVFLPLQNTIRECVAAKMSFAGASCAHDFGKEKTVIVPSRSYLLPNGKEITTDGIPVSFDKEKLEKLLEAGLPCISNGPSQRCTYRMLYNAASRGDIEQTLNCLCHGLDPNHQFKDLANGTALHVASATGFLTVIYLLKQAGALVNLVDKEQNTSLIMAAISGHSDVVKFLMKAGADISFKGKDGMTALHQAAKYGHLEVVHYLMAHPTAPYNFVNLVDDGGWTPLIWAAEFSHFDIILYLLSRGADPMIRDVEHNVALHWAACSGNVDISEYLLRYKSDINSTNVRGDTPLHICARRDHYPCIVMLLAHGARTDIRNVDGLLALDCCLNKPSDSYNAIKLNIQLNEIVTRSRKKSIKILSNDISRGHELNPIQCINSIDNETYPTDFVYITENCFTSHIKVNRIISSLKSCTCTDSCSNVGCSCGIMSLGGWYTDYGTLKPEFNYAEPPMIFECNPMCLCNKITCNNRVVQHGSNARFQLCRTKNKGWGVETLRKIPKGTYVCEYIGEIISDTEADVRTEDSYLFDLDNRDGETYCIDAYKYGNIARFINHSCVPNLQPVKVFISHHDLHFPRISFFANRDIEPYEELGFDYGEKFWIIKCKSFTCSCGAEKCRFSESTINKTLAAYNKRIRLEESMSSAT